MTLPANTVRAFARAGYGARGVVYLIVGGFAALAAWSGGENKSAKGALETLLSQPFGQSLVWIVTSGLCGYAMWRFIQSVFDTDDHGFTPKGLAVRAGLIASGVTYAYLALVSLAMLGALGPWSVDDGGSSSGPAAWASAALGAAPTLVGMAVIFCGIACAHWWKAYKRKYEDHFDAPSSAMSTIHAVSIAGLTARGISFFILAAIAVLRLTGDAAGGSGDKPGVKEALEFAQGLPGGRWLLLTLGIGLILFAGYSLLEARWRRINVEDA